MLIILLVILIIFFILSEINDNLLSLFKGYMFSESVSELFCGELFVSLLAISLPIKY